MPEGMVKDYDYDQVLSFTGPNGPLDQALSKLQNDLLALRLKVNECEPLYHGKGSTSSIYLTYANLYNKIGTVTGGGMWANAFNSKGLINAMYENALVDKSQDLS